MQLRFERRLRCDPGVAFAWLSVPDAMNRWSKARIVAGSPGDGESAAGVGALRTVFVPRGGRLEEVIVESLPPHRFVYRVYRGTGIRTHRGEITLDGHRGARAETRLCWNVDATFAVPGMGLVASRILERELAASLDTLARLVVDEPTPESSPPPLRRIDESHALPALFDEAEAILVEQRALADELMAKGDPRAWFTRSYEHVTALQIDFCRAGKFTHPGWVLRLVPIFHRYYVGNLERSLANSAHRRSVGEPEEHWAEAFARMQRRRVARGSRYKTMARCTLYGMIAHIEEDLPRALAEVYVQHYQGLCDYARFRADYLAMEPIFREAGRRLLYGELSPLQIPPPTQVLMQLPYELRDAIMHRELYDIPRNRVRAFGRGERMVRLFSGVRA